MRGAGADLVGSSDPVIAAGRATGRTRGPVTQFHRGHPLDPPEAATAGRDQPDRRAAAGPLAAGPRAGWPARAGRHRPPGSAAGSRSRWSLAGCGRPRAGPPGARRSASGHAEDHSASAYQPLVQSNRAPTRFRPSVEIGHRNQRAGNVGPGDRWRQPAPITGPRWSPGSRRGAEPVRPGHDPPAGGQGPRPGRHPPARRTQAPDPSAKPAGARRVADGSRRSAGASGGDAISGAPQPEVQRRTRRRREPGSGSARRGFRYPTKTSTNPAARQTMITPASRQAGQPE